MKSRKFLLLVFLFVCGFMHANESLSVSYSGTSVTDNGENIYVKVMLDISNISSIDDMNVGSAYSAIYKAIYTTDSQDDSFNITDVFRGTARVIMKSVVGTDYSSVVVEFSQNPLPGATSPLKTRITFYEQLNDHSLSAVWNAAPYSFAQDATVEIIDKPIELNTYTVTYNTGANGAFADYTSNVVTESLLYGDAPSIPSVNVDSGWVFAGWSPEIPEIITSDLNTTALYKQITYTITATSGVNGSITPEGDTEVVYGGTQDYVISAADHYHITDVKVDGNSIRATSSYSFANITGDHSIAVSFAVDEYSVKFDAGTHGVISSGDISQTVAYGSGAVAPVVEANYGWIFTGWDVDFSNVTGDLNVTAQYEEVEYELVVVDGSGSGHYSNDDVIDISVSYNDTGLEFKEWIVEPAEYSVNVEDLSAAETIFLMPAADVTITAVFADTENLVGEIYLTKGWNLVSISIEPDTPAVRDIFSEDNIVNIDDVVLKKEKKGLGILHNACSWGKSKKGKRSHYQKVKEVHASQVLWVHYRGKTPVTLRYSGTAPEDTSISLLRGWNLVTPCETVTIAEEAPVFAVMECTGKNKLAYSDKTLQPGKVYWVYTRKECIIAGEE